MTERLSLHFSMWHQCLTAWPGPQPRGPSLVSLPSWPLSTILDSEPSFLSVLRTKSQPRTALSCVFRGTVAPSRSLGAPVQCDVWCRVGIALSSS